MSPGAVGLFFSYGEAKKISFGEKQPHIAISF